MAPIPYFFKQRHISVRHFDGILEIIMLLLFFLNVKEEPVDDKIACKITQYAESKLHGKYSKFFGTLVAS